MLETVDGFERRLRLCLSQWRALLTVTLWLIVTQIPMVRGKGKSRKKSTPKEIELTTSTPLFLGNAKSKDKVSSFCNWSQRSDLVKIVTFVTHVDALS